MKIALCSDELYPIHSTIQKELESQGHEVILMGACASGEEESWIEATSDAAIAVANQDCDEGIFFCWTGTGAAMVANKIPGVRAALCGDSVSASVARIWNKANVLCLSNRLLSEDIAKEILEVWLNEANNDENLEVIQELEDIESLSETEDAEAVI